MSIQLYEIAERIKSRDLRLLPPMKVGMPISPVRVLLLTKAMWQMLVDGPWPDETHKTRLGAILRADLEDFISGKTLLVSMGGRDLVIEDMKRLQEVHEVWEFKSKAKRGVRVFGRFAGHDVFVATNWQWRDQLSSYGSDEWALEINKCTDTWNSLFSKHAPHTGVDIHAYLSNAEDANLLY